VKLLALTGSCVKTILAYLNLGGRAEEYHVAQELSAGDFIGGLSTFEIGAAGDALQ
jgi:hypothetical protein